MNNEKIKQQIETTNATINHLIDVKSMLEKQLEEGELGCRRVEIGVKYYFTSHTGVIIRETENGNGADDRLYAAGNYYRTYKQAQAALDRQLAIVRVNDRINELKNGLDINDIDADYSWLICWSHREMKLSFNSFSADLKLTSVLRNLPNKRVAVQIIDECTDDLKLILGAV